MHQIHKSYENIMGDEEKDLEGKVKYLQDLFNLEHHDQDVEQQEDSDITIQCKINKYRTTPIYL